MVSSKIRCQKSEKFFLFFEERKTHIRHDRSNLHNLLFILVEYCGFISRILFFVFYVTIQTVIYIRDLSDDFMEDIDMYLVEFTTYTNPAEVSYEFGSIDDVKTFLEKNRELLRSYVVVHKNGNIVKL